MIVEIVLGTGAQDPNNSALTLVKSMDFKSCLVTKCLRSTLSQCVTREQVDSQSKVTKRYVGKGHTWRGRNLSSSHKYQNAMEILLGDNLVQRIVMEQ